MQKVFNRAEINVCKIYRPTDQYYLQNISEVGLLSTKSYDVDESKQQIFYMIKHSDKSLKLDFKRFSSKSWQIKNWHRHIKCFAKVDFEAFNFGSMSYDSENL